MTVTELPRPSIAATPGDTPRWIPHRAGIVNVWRYYDETFEFHHGRLLLRGPNGSGKSKALELLLPFLFDASLRANRLSTFGGNERSMHWNLMGDGASGTTRVGYVWVEFRHTGAPERWFTCGARLQASTHTTTVHPDYFTTQLRIGMPSGLALVNEAGQPLTKAALEERLGDDGTLAPTATDYRTTVRSTLFGDLSEQRYDALITALLQLRTPKLSQRLDPAVLSTLLSAALPPIGQQEIADLAEGFERLDAQRERLVRLEEEVAAARTLAARQKTYAQRVLRAGAAAVISATTELDNLTRAARASAAEAERVAADRDEAEGRAAQLAADIAEGEARKDGLIESDAYKKGQELDRLREQTERSRAAAAAVRSQAETDRRTAQGDAEAHRAAATVEQQRTEQARGRQVEAGHAATRAGLAGVHGELGVLVAEDAARARQFLRGATRSRHEQIEAVGSALGLHERAVERRQDAEKELEDTTTALGAATERLGSAQQARAAALDTLIDRTVGWATGCKHLRFPDPGELGELAESEPAVLEAVDAVVGAELEKITRAEAAQEAVRTIASGERADLVIEEGQLAAARDIPPAVPHTRTSDRSRMLGGPLWELVEFAEQVPDGARATIEAALEGAGLLDAWLGPRGEIAGHDVFADADALAPVTAGSLADVLVPATGGAADPAAVARVLAAISFADELPDGPAAIGADGTWRMGAATGSWEKSQAAHIGATARRQARERRRAQVLARIAELDDDLAAVDAELVSLAARRTVVAAERAARPSYAELDATDRDLRRSEADRDAADAAVNRRVAAVAEREGVVRQSTRVLSTLAAEHGTPTDRTALAALAAAVTAFREQADAFLDAHGDALRAGDNAAAAAARAERSVHNAEQREEAADTAEREHAALAARLHAIEGALSTADYREVLAEIGRLRRQLQELTAEGKSVQRQISALAERLGGLRSTAATDAEVRDAAGARRDAAALRFRHLATGVLPTDAELDDLPRFDAVLAASDGVRAALDAARIVAASWASVPYAPSNLGDALHRLSESVHTVRTSLSARADLELQTDEDVQIFVAIVDGVRVGAAALRAILASEVEHSRNEITEREQALFDQTLTGDTRRHLAARIRQANELVDGMNARLERVRTASQVAVKLVWQVAPELPPGTAAARELLLKDPARLSESDRESLHRFFRERIEHAKADDTAATWEQQLAQVFDYTAWHRFTVRIDRADGTGWQPLTKKLHGALSGGEKAIALHLPLFAAVAAHYQVAPEAPRVILLDEVFVGVDSRNRGQVFALLSALQLDLMLTSDHEWCTYAELSGIGIHQLITGQDGDDAVTTARFTWDGRSLNPEDGTASRS
jgi:uncharacterized protein (TIGR02680 family)